MSILESIFKRIDLGESQDTKLGLAYFIFRLLVPLMFLQHGLQKLFGAFGGVGGSGQVATLGTMTWWAGLIEVVVGIAVPLGLFSRFFGLIAFVEMVIAYFMVHAPNSFYPIMNRGELAAMFALSFLLIARYGNGRWSLEKKIFKREIF